MKIAMYVPVWPAGLEANGVVTYASNLVPALRRMGHEVYVVTMKSNDPDDLYTIELKKFDKKLPFWHRALFRVLPSLAGFVENSERLARAVRFMVEKHGIEVLEIEEAFGFSKAVSDLKLIPVVVRLHGPWFINKRYEDRLREKRERRGIEGASFVTSPSAIILKRTKARYQNLPDSTTIPNPIKPSVEHWTLKACQPNTILYVGRFDAVKGGPLVIKAFNELALKDPGVTLTFVGPDVGILNEAGQLEKFDMFATRTCSESIRARINFLGAVPPAQIPSLRLGHFLTICASNSEILPYAILEAMSLGCPIVTTDAGGIPEMIRHGENGLIVPRGDLSSFVNACEQFLSNHGLAASLGAQARIDCNQYYNIDVIATKTVVTFASLLKNTHPSHAKIERHSS